MYLGQQRLQLTRGIGHVFLSEDILLPRAAAESCVKGCQQGGEEAHSFCRAADNG
jgi:hypothetical protein